MMARLAILAFGMVAWIGYAAFMLFATLAAARALLPAFLAAKPMDLVQLAAVGAVVGSAGMVAAAMILAWRRA